MTIRSLGSFCHIRRQKSRYRIEIGIFVILSTIPGTASRIRSSSSGNMGESAPAFANPSVGVLEAIPY